MTQIDDVVPPVVCTLSIGRKAEQVLEWTDLVPLALSRREIENGAESTYPLALAAQIEDLATREMSCCGSWLNINFALTDAHVELTVTTSNPEGLEPIRRLSGLGTTA